MSPACRSLELLRKAADQFRFYEKSHNAKVDRYRHEQETTNSRHYREDVLPGLIQDTAKKARVNGALAAEFEAHIKFLEDDAA